jgi:hypothetical protein
MQTEAMARLDTVLGRSPLDAAERAPDEPLQTVLWLDEDPAAMGRQASEGNRGPDKGPYASRQVTKGPT